MGGWGIGSGVAGRERMSSAQGVKDRPSFVKYVCTRGCDSEILIKLLPAPEVILILFKGTPVFA